MERGLESHGHSTLARRKTRKLVGSFVPDFKVDSAFGVYGSFRRRPTTETQKFGASRPKVLTHAEMRHGIMESDAFAAVDPSVLAAAQMEEPKEKPSMWASALAFWGFEEQATGETQSAGPLWSLGLYNAKLSEDQ
ncbi:hypothetical protein DFJ73DRAFT_787650 [Zopfochytrium polystomum]|nr:hypothetical protein DFJ73DRAFT_787650 [Zopfochytrium polystomum]